MKLFEGVTVLDVSRVLGAPFAAKYFADYGATVYKIEHPARGDESMTFPPIKGDYSAYYHMLNRKKQLVHIDFKNEEQKGRFYEMVKTTDVVIENNTPGTSQKLGIDYETLKKYNPQLIYLSISGYGQHSRKRAYDTIVQAESGFMSLNGETGPLKVSPAIMDIFSGTNGAWAVSSALYYREKTGKGQYIDLSMVGCGMHLCEGYIAQTSIQGPNPQLVGNQDNTICPFGVYRTRDYYLIVAIGNDHTFQKFRDVFLPNLGEGFATNQERVSNQAALVQAMEEAFQSYTTAELLIKGEKLGLPFGQIRTMIDLINDPELHKNNYLTTLHHPILGTVVYPHEAIKFSESRLGSS